MEFPVWIRLGPLTLHPHLVFEALAYVVGFRLFLVRRGRAGDLLPIGVRMSVVAAAAVGAAVGSKLLVWLADPAATWAHRADLVYLMAGKTIVGGLIGGWIAVEWTKLRLGIRRATGDLFAVPLAVGIAIGRIGCLLTGVADRTCGVATESAWGMNLGDGILRHPTPLYEIAFLALLAAGLAWRSRRPFHEGDLFRAFMAAYAAFRIGVDFLKPGVPLFGLTALQWVCAGVLVFLAAGLGRRGAACRARTGMLWHAPTADLPSPGDSAESVPGIGGRSTTECGIGGVVVPSSDRTGMACHARTGLASAFAPAGATADKRQTPAKEVPDA